MSRYTFADRAAEAQSRGQLSQSLLPPSLEHFPAEILVPAVTHRRDGRLLQHPPSGVNVLRHCGQATVRELVENLMEFRRVPRCLATQLTEAGVQASCMAHNENVAAWNKKAKFQINTLFLVLFVCFVLFCLRERRDCYTDFTLCKPQTFTCCPQGSVTKPHCVTS